MSDSRLTQHLLREWIDFPIALASSVGLIMTSPMILTTTTGFGLGDGTFAVAMLAVLLLTLTQPTTFTEATCLLPTRGSVCGYPSCGLGRFLAITGTLSIYLIVHVFVGAVRTMLSGTMALADFESLNTLTESGGGAWLVGVGMVLCLGLLNALGITAFGRAKVILALGMWGTLIIFAVAGLLRLPTMELQDWFGTSTVGDDLPTLLSLVGMAIFMFVSCEFVTSLTPGVRHASRTLSWAMALGLVEVACCTFLYDTAIRRRVENPNLDGGLHLLKMSVAIPRFAEQVMGLFGRIWLGVGLLFAGAATVNILTAGLLRILYGMALDGALSKAFTYLRPRSKIPLLYVAVAAAIPCLYAWQLGDDSEGIIHLALATVCAWGTAYLLVTLSVVPLRARRPDLPHTYRSPLFPLPQSSPSAGILLGMFYITPPDMNSADIYLPFTLILDSAVAYAPFWTLCVQRVDPFHLLTVEEVLEREFAEEDRQQRERAYVHLGVLI